LKGQDSDTRYANNTVFNSALANTNAYIATTAATERSSLANTNAYIATTAAGSGKVLQVVQVESSTQETFTSSSYTEASSLVLNITPSSSSNKIMVFLDLGYTNWNNSSNDSYGYYRIKRTAPSTANSLHSSQRLYDYGGSGAMIGSSNALNWLDSPSTTSQVTYKIEIAFITGTESRINYAGMSSRLTAMEVSA
jgi:hypothetical protein